MNAAHRTLAALALAAAGALAGCSSTKDSGEDVQVNLPTQEQADSAARSKITSANADSEFKKLSQEINSSK